MPPEQPLDLYMLISLNVLQEQLEQEKPTVCPLCGKRFPREEQIEIHMRKIH